MKKNLLLLLMLLVISTALLNAQIIEGQSGSKYVSLKKQPTVSVPVITWKYPAQEFYSTTERNHNFEVCITSEEKPSNMILYVDKVRQDNRNFKITPVGSGCDYSWKVTMNFSTAGKYFLEFEATNSAGKATKSCVLEIKDANANPTPSPTPNPTPSNARRLALIIGNGNYEEKPLANPVNDANDMASKLQGLGFTVYKHTDLDKTGIGDAVSTFKGQIRTGDIAVFFYAGHGYQVGGESFILPIGAINSIKSETDAEDEGYRINRVIGNMQEAGAATSIVFLDACRDSPIRSAFRSSNSSGLAFPKSQPTGSVVSFATAAGSVASDGSGRNGTYTAALLKHLQKDVSISDILTLVNGEVKKSTGNSQTPEFKSSLDNIFKF